MHSKIIHPKRHGRFVFSNRSSCSKTVTYLGHEAREQQTETRFFNSERTDVSAEEVSSAIDSNAKGLRKHQEKFYSLVLSPSDQELAHLDNSPEKLRQYTRKVMENYAANFRLRHKGTGAAYGKRLSSSDLVWFATIHEQRKEKQGEQKGIAKPGGHTHVHILVSGKDRSGEHRLNPREGRSRFYIPDWQVQNGKTFQQMFGYKRPTISEKLTSGISEERMERYQERIREKVGYLNEYFTGSQKLDVEKALSIGQEQQYGRGFFFNLHKLTKQYQEGKRIDDPYHMLETSQDKPISLPERTLFHIAKQSEEMGQAEGIEALDKPRKKPHRPLNHPSLER